MIISINTLPLYQFSDPRDPHRRIVRRVVAKTNNWVRIYDRYGGNNIFVPSGYSWVESEEDSNPWENDSRDFGPVSITITLHYSLPPIANLFTLR